MAAARRRRGRPRPPARHRPDYEGHCSACGVDVLWLLNNRTGKKAPIDQYPEPGGNITISLTAGTYRVLTAEEARDLDPTTANPDANPTLYVHHAANCVHEVRRRNQAARQGTLPLALPDGTPLTSAKHHAAPTGIPRCPGCDVRFTYQELAAGLTRHPTC